MNSISFSDLIALWIASLVQSCSPREDTAERKHTICSIQIGDGF